MIRVGTYLFGFCGGHFGRDSYEDKRVEAVGADWVVAREIESGRVVFSDSEPEALEAFVDQDPMHGDAPLPRSVREHVEMSFDPDIDDESVRDADFGDR